MGVTVENTAFGLGVALSHVQADGAAAQAGLQNGDVLLSINGVLLRSHQQAIAEIDKPVPVLSVVKRC